MDKKFTFIVLLCCLLTCGCVRNDIIIDSYPVSFTSTTLGYHPNEVVSTDMVYPVNNVAVDRTPRYDTYYLLPSPKKPESYGKICFIGDSRTVGLGMTTANLKANNVNGYSAVNGSCGDVHYLGMVSQGYNWLNNTAINEIPEDVDTVCLWLGVNDLGNINKYIDLYHALENKYRVVLFTVGPVDETKYYNASVNNETIAKFNEQLISEFPDNTIDLFTWMNTVGFSSNDGLHYTKGEYYLIANFIEDNLHCKCQPDFD